MPVALISSKFPSFFIRKVSIRPQDLQLGTSGFPNVIHIQMWWTLVRFQRLCRRHVFVLPSPHKLRCRFHYVSLSFPLAFKTPFRDPFGRKRKGIAFIQSFFRQWPKTRVTHTQRNKQPTPHNMTNTSGTVDGRDEHRLFTHIQVIWRILFSQIVLVKYTDLCFFFQG